MGHASEEVEPVPKDTEHALEVDSASGFKYMEKSIALLGGRPGNSLVNTSWKF